MYIYVNVFIYTILYYVYKSVQYGILQLLSLNQSDLNSFTCYFFLLQQFVMCLLV